MLQHSVSNKNAAANSQIKPLSLVPFCCVHTLAVVILEPLSTTDESTLFRTMAPPCNVCFPPSHVCCHLLMFDCSCPKGRSQSGGARVTIGACGITRLVVLDVGRAKGGGAAFSSWMPCLLRSVVLYYRCPIRWPRCVLGPARPQPHLPSDGSRASPPRDVIAY